MMRVLLFSVCLMLLAAPALLANNHDFETVNPNQGGVQPEQRALKADQVAKIERALALARAKMRVKQLGNAPDKDASMREGNAEIRQLEQALELARAEARVEELENAPVSAVKSSQAQSQNQGATQPKSQSENRSQNQIPSALTVMPDFFDTEFGRVVLWILILYPLIFLL